MCRWQASVATRGSSLFLDLKSMFKNDYGLRRVHWICDISAEMRNQVLVPGSSESWKTYDRGGFVWSTLLQLYTMGSEWRSQKIHGEGSSSSSFRCPLRILSSYHSLAFDPVPDYQESTFEPQRESSQPSVPLGPSRSEYLAQGALDKLQRRSFQRRHSLQGSCSIPTEISIPSLGALLTSNKPESKSAPTTSSLSSEQHGTHVQSDDDDDSIHLYNLKGKGYHVKESGMRRVISMGNLSKLQASQSL